MTIDRNTCTLVVLLRFRLLNISISKFGKQLLPSSDSNISLHPGSLFHLTSKVGEGVYFLKCIAFQCDGYTLHQLR